MLTKPNPSSTILYASAEEMESHAVRFIMAEKDIERKIAYLKPPEIPEELLEILPEQIVMPVLFDRGIVLYDLSVITEYLDERFPFPSLLPVDPIEKAEKRQLIFRFTRAEGCWYGLAKTIETGSKKEADRARKELTSSLLEVIPLFTYQPYFKSDEMGIVDACLAPLLWRLKKLDIDLGKNAKPIYDYSKRLFSKDSFKNSLADCEKEYNI